MTISKIRLAATAIAALTITAAAHAGQFTVESGKTKPLRLKSKAGSVVIGNPNIADVAVHNDKLIFVSGKTFGTTNLMIFDSNGNTIYSSDIVVTTNTANLVTINRGGENFTFDCAPNCRAGLSVGDADRHFNQTYNQIDRQSDLTE